MNTLPAQFDFKNLEALISRARKRRHLTDLENGLLNVATNILARAEHGADAKRLSCLMAMAEKIEVILTRKIADGIDPTGHFHRSVHKLANSQIGIEQRAA